ncbi:MAG: MerR family transcriptional regulator [Myxococcota bacterium]
MHSVGRLARKHGLSRTTLLYYDRLRLLRPSARSPAGYRLYTDDDERRLEAICRYRKVGLTLEQIRTLLAGDASGTARVLEARLDQLNAEIEALREQQRVIVRLLERPRALRGTRSLDKARWVAILRGAGLDDAAMRRWHAEFERQAPQAHQDFLESLGLAKEEARRIRRWSAARAPGASGSARGAPRAR